MNSQKRIRAVSVLIAIVSVLLVVMYAMYSATNDVPYSDEKTAGLALAELSVDTGEIEKRIDNIFGTVRGEFSPYAPSGSDKSGLRQSAELLLGELGAVSVKLMNGGNAYASYGDDTTLLASEVKRLLGSGKALISSTYEDSKYGAEVVAVYVPISMSEGSESDFNAALLVYRTSGFIGSVFKNTELHSFGDQSQLFCFASINGGVLYTSESNTNLIDPGSNIYDFINAHLTQSNAYFDGDYVRSSLNGTKTYLTLDYNGVSYIGAFKVISGMENNFVAFGFYEPDLFANATPVTEMLFSVFAIVLLVLLLLFFVFLVTDAVNRRKAKADNTDTSGECENMTELRAKVASVMKRNSYSAYAVVRAKLTNTDELENICGTETASKLQRFVGAVIAQNITSAECYGSAENGGYVFLLRYTTKQSLIERIRLISSVVNSHPVMKENRNVSRLCIGVSCKQKGESFELDVLFDQAEAAMSANANRKTEFCVMYSDRMNEGVEHDADLEQKMTQALKNNEFKIFIQPEYSLRNNMIDGAEVFVKWFDESNGSFQTTDEFLPAMGDTFTITLERYVYTETLKLLREAIGHRSRISPISVSVSACNALSADFCNFYTAQKRKYNIPDNYITVIFTEADLKNNRSQLHTVASNLKMNGIYTAVSVNGTGTADFKSLRSQGVDMVKLDSSLIASLGTGGNTSTLDEIFHAAKTLGFKTVQKGVSGKAEFKLLQSLGCDVIQGDVYSKPIRMSDYITFVNNDTTISR